MPGFILLLLLLLSPSVLTHRPNLFPTSQLLFQSSEFRSFENLAVRANGHLVLTMTNQPFIYDLDPNAHSSSLKLLHQFPNVQSTLGIAETAADVFAVVVGDYAILQAVAGSFSVWSVDLNTPEPTVKLITSIPEAGGLGGMATLNEGSDMILVGDPVLGAVWRVNVTTGEYGIAIQSPFFDRTSAFPGGINGIRVFDRMLYFTNSAQGTYGRVSITNDGNATGEVQILARVEVPAAIYDDFDIDRNGNAWITAHPNSLLEVTSGGDQRNITGNITDLLDPVSARFGRGFDREEILYVLTYGSTSSATAGGQVIAVNNSFSPHWRNQSAVPIKTPRTTLTKRLKMDGLRK